MRFVATKTPEQQKGANPEQARQQTSVILVIRAHLANGIVRLIGRHGVEYCSALSRMQMCAHLHRDNAEQLSTR